MGKFTFKLPFGIWISNISEGLDGTCQDLVNLIPTPQGLVVRKGHEVLDKINIYEFIGTISSLQSIFLIQDTLLTLYNVNLNSYKTITIESTIGKPTNYVETNEGAIVFYDSNLPYFLSKDNSYTILNFTGSVTPPVYFSGVVRYRERLFFYQKGNNIIYYLGVGTFQGELIEYDVSNIFNTNGNIIFVEVLGYETGLQLNSNLVVGFDTGDILVLNGTNPEDINYWSAVTSIHLGVKLYGYTTRVGTSLFALSDNGLIDIQIAINNGNIYDALRINTPLLQANLPYQYMSLFSFNKYILLLVNNYSYDYWYNLETKGWFKLDGITIAKQVSLYGNLYILNDKGYFFKLLSSKEDDYYNEINEPPSFEKRPINAVYTTDWSWLNGSQNYKKMIVSTIDLNINGDIESYYGAGKDYDNDSYKLSSLPRQLSLNGSNWSNIDPVPIKDGKEKFLWGKLLNRWTTIKFPCHGIGRAFSIKMTLICNELKDATIGNITVEFQEGIK